MRRPSSFRPARGCGSAWPALTSRTSGRHRRTRRWAWSTGPGLTSVLRLPVSGGTGRADTPAAVAGPPAEADTGWVTDGEPLYRVTQDKAAAETAVTFGARSRLQPPSGADLRLDETFTARVSPGRPAGATVLAQVDISLRLPGGERVQVAVRSTSHRRSSVIAASVVLDGTIGGWTSDGRAVPRTGPRSPAAPVTRRNGEPSVELVGYAQPCVAHPGGTVDVKVSSTLPEFTAEVVRLGLQAEPAAPPVGGRFPGRYQELLSGSYLVADLSGEEPATAGQTAALWFCPTWLPGPQCLMAGQARDGGWELGIGEDHRVRVAVRAGIGRAAPRPLRRPGARDGHWYFAAASWDSERPGHPGGPAPQLPERGPSGRFRSSRPMPGRMTWASRARLPSSSASAPRCAGQARTGASTGRSTPRDCSRACLPAASLAALAADAPAARVGGLRHEWRFSPDASLPPHRVRDTGPGRCDGTLVNSPTLGVTGRNWTPGTESFVVGPDEYGAAYFHEDDLTDAGWETSLSFQVPAEWPSGAYGIRLRAGEHEDVVPLIVSAAPGRTGAGQSRPASPAPGQSPAGQSPRWPRPRRGAPADLQLSRLRQRARLLGASDQLRGRRLRAAGHRPRPLHGLASAAQPVRPASGRHRVLPVLVAPPGAEHAPRLSPPADPRPAPVQRRPRAPALAGAPADRGRCADRRRPAHPRRRPR